VMESSARRTRFEPQAQPPPVRAAAPTAQENAEHDSLLRKIGRFFAAIFR